jgi:hypothetical protein
LKNLSAAQEELVRAEAADPNSAVSKFWLGLLLLKDRKINAAVERFKQASEINQFIFYLIMKQNKPITGRSDLVQNKTNSYKWEIILNQYPFIEKLPPMRFVDRIFGNTPGEGRILSASSNGAQLAVVWEWWDYWSSRKRNCTVINISNGELLWSKSTPERKLIFASPKLVVLEINENLFAYELLDIQTGQIKAWISKNYFETVFCPNYNLLAETEVFKNSNCELGFLVNDIKITDPYGLDLYSIQLRNVSDSHEFVSGSGTRTTVTEGDGIITRPK